MEIEIFGNTFRMLHQKALFWADKKTLLISDLHMGKVTHFRKAGIAIPSAAYTDNFKRLDELVMQNSPERIFFLGDLFHNKYNEEWVKFAAWRDQYPSIEIKIVLGNHDIIPLSLFEETDISVSQQLREDNFLFVHHPIEQNKDGIYSFCGHIHPVHILRSRVKQALRLPCFVFDQHQAILPSFGVFTGGHPMETLEYRNIYVIAENRIFAT